MAWYFGSLAVNVRRFTDGQSYARRDYPDDPVQNGREYYISGMLNDSGRGPVRARDWLELRADLHHKFGVELIESERHGEEKS